MCSAAHAWVGLGKIVYVASAHMLEGWLREFGLDGNVVEALPVQRVAPGVEVRGPVPELEEEIKALHRRFAGL